MGAIDEIKVVRALWKSGWLLMSSWSSKLSEMFKFTSQHKPPDMTLNFDYEAGDSVSKEAESAAGMDSTMTEGEHTISCTRGVSGENACKQLKQ